VSSSISETILRFIRDAPITEFDGVTFNALALELFRYQTENNAVYRGICEQQGMTSERVTNWRDIPAVTSSAFKTVALTCFPPQDAVAVFHTSGTTQKRSGKHYFRTLDFYRAAMRRSFAAYCLDQRASIALGSKNEPLHDSLKAVMPEESCYESKPSSEMKQDSTEAVIPEESFYNSKPSLENKKDSSGMTFSFSVGKIAKMRMLFLGPTTEHFPNSSLGYMFSVIRYEFGDEKSAVFFSPKGVDTEGFRKALEKASQDNVPVFLLGTTLALLECMEKFAQQGRKFHLPSGSRILDTGGYKVRQIKVSREAFQRQLSETFGVPKEYLLNEYGMTELSSQFYNSSLPGISSLVERAKATPFAAHPSPFAHRPSPWVRVAAVDPETLKILPAGEVGLLRIFDLANVDSVMAIQTEDLGRAWPDRIELLGRARGAELRGCSLLTEAIVRSA
jgi:acyl-CoA synthetase (AMP-forming)/AMP-acid ligase II